jgi:hypothetical protein
LVKRVLLNLGKLSKTSTGGGGAAKISANYVQRSEQGGNTSISKMTCSDVEVVIHTWFNSLEDFTRPLEGYSWNLIVLFTDILDFEIVIHLRRVRSR